MDEDTGIMLKQKKPRSEAQIQALNKARAKALELRTQRNDIRQKLTTRMRLPKKLKQKLKLKTQKQKQKQKLMKNLKQQS